MSLLANIFSAIGACFMAYSTFGRKKENMLIFQALDAVCSAIGCLLVGSYSAMTTDVIAAIRNFLNAKGKMTKFLMCFIILCTIVIALVVNTKGWIGLLPILASVEYSVLSFKVTSAQALRWALVVNLVLWLIHDICVSLYPSIVMDSVMIIVTLANIIRYQQKRQNDKSE